MENDQNLKNAGTSELVRACLMRDGLAWAEFISRYSVIIERAIIKRLKAHGYSPAVPEKEEIKQALFVKIWETGSLESVKDAENINFWVAIVAANFATDFFRQRKNDVLTNSASLFEEIVTENRSRVFGECVRASSPDPRQITNAKIIEENYNNAVMEMDHNEKIALDLFFFHEMKYTEISSVTGLSAAAIASVIFRARKKIKNSLQSKGFFLRLYILGGILCLALS